MTVSRRALLVTAAAAPLAACRAPESEGPAPTATAALDPDFKTSDFRALDLADEALPYASGVAPRADDKAHDSNGVRKKVIGRRTYDHPVAQAQWGIANEATYRRVGDPLFLERAVANAKRIIATRVTVRTSDGPAWFYPYPFDFPLHGGMPLGGGTAFTAEAPWFSGMAQGLAISLFARLAKDDPARAVQWRNASSATYRSFLVAPSRTAPWVVHVDPARYLWLDEYPVADRPGESDLTLNGHLFGIFGLYEHYKLTGDVEALRLYDGALTTVVHYLPQFRTPGGLSRYCLAHVVRDPKYHGVHIGQLRSAHQMTGDVVFARAAADLRRDA